MDFISSRELNYFIIVLTVVITISTSAPISDKGSHSHKSPKLTALSYDYYEDDLLPAISKSDPLPELAEALRSVLESGQIDTSDELIDQEEEDEEKYTDVVKRGTDSGSFETSYDANGNNVVKRNDVAMAKREGKKEELPDTINLENDNGIKDGIIPVPGPYINLTAKGSIPDDDDGDDINIGGKTGFGKTRGVEAGQMESFQNWDEYLENQRNAIKAAVALRSPLEEGSVLRSVVHSDDHFRFMDKLFKEKNDKVKAFHSLVLFMRRQGKDFKIPQKPRPKKIKNFAGNKLK